MLATRRFLIPSVLKLGQRCLFTSGHVQDTMSMEDKRRQSPIDIRNSTPHDIYPKLQVSFTSAENDRLIAKNTGSTVHVDCVDKVMGRLTGGPVYGDNYSLEQFHFHWGDSKGHGSEHTLDGVKYEAELHLVFKNENYPTVGEAVENPDGLAVLGVLLKEIDENPDGKDESNEGVLPELFDNLPRIEEEGDLTVIPESIDLFKALPESKSYYTYLGSLTTPGYDECVTWILFDNPVEINSRDMAKLRDLKTKDGCSIVNNYRAVQSLCGRGIRYVGNRKTQTKPKC